MTAVEQRHDDARQRIGQVFRYLQALNDQRNPAIRQLSRQEWIHRLADLPSHHTVRRGSLLAGVLGPDLSGRESSDEYILRVRRPHITLPPSPPEQLRDWLMAGWVDFPGTVETVQLRSIRNDDGEVVDERFEDDSRRSDSLVRWQADREAWLEQERPARAAAQLFAQLYELHGRLEKEPERLELLVGDGLLIWQTPVGVIRHPVLLQRVQLLIRASARKPAQGTQPAAGPGRAPSRWAGCLGLRARAQVSRVRPGDPGVHRQRNRPPTGLLRRAIPWPAGRGCSAHRSSP
jgi:hypothetical protein